jgi:hypothetical protein
MKSKWTVFLLGVLVGCSLAAVTLVVPVIDGRLAANRHSGEILTKLELARLIDRELVHAHEPADGDTTPFQIKDVDVMVVQRNGVKTLAVRR